MYTRPFSRRTRLAPKSARSVRWSKLEQLEPRIAPAGIPAITEFMALNDSTLADSDGEFSDWIEIQNQGDATIDLAGWKLTDDPSDPAQWTFPSTTLAAGQRLVVFASGKDRTGSGELHTNFSLNGDGEYLALISPAGDFVASEFEPYPQQYDDIAYGLGSEQVGEALFGAGDPLRAHVPSDNSLGSSWTGSPANEPFDDTTADWQAGSSGVGFDQNGPAAPPQQAVGHTLLNRPTVDGAVGSIFLLESQRFGGPGLITSWSIYSETDGMVTPLLLQANDFGEYEITGIGTSRTVNSSGVQSFDFDLQSGSGAVDSDTLFGWKDGTNGTNNAGVADYTNGTSDSVRYFNQHTNFALGENLGVGSARNRTYSFSASATAAFALEPLAYWSFDGHAADESSGSATGEIRGATFSNEIPIFIGTGQSLSFDGGSDYVSVPLDVPETSYSSSLWFRTSSTSRGLFAVVDGDLGAGGHDRHVYLSGGNIAARTWSNETIASNGQNYADGSWHLVVHTVGAAVGGQQLYVDGQLVASGSKSGSDFNWQQRVNIGFSNDAASDYFQGEIDDVAIWPAALDATQINALYQGSSPIALSGYGPWIGLDLESAFAGSSSAYVRSTIEVADTTGIDALELNIRYDDGFIAYLNGVQIARRNAPGTASFDSTALADRPPGEALRPEVIDVPLPAGLLQAGENVLAYQLLGDSTVDADLLLAPEVFALRTLGQRYLEPTPGEGNGHGVIGFVAEPVISVPHGFYQQSFATSIDTATADAEIYYTLDGSTPNPTNPAATLYASPLTISGTTTLRAAAVKPDHEPSAASTASYLFLSDIVQQPALPDGYPDRWSGNALADYGIDPEVTNNTLPGYSFDDALLSLPTVSIVTEHDSLWSPTSGIYYNSQQRGRDWERAASIELIYPDGSQSHQVDAGIRMHGNSSRNHSFTPKHPIRLHFRGDYGATMLDFPLFDDADYTSFDQLLLRPSSTDSWPVANGSFVQGVQRWHPDHATYIRDQWMRDSQIALGMPSPHGTYVHLFLNGLYWGQYNIAERPSDDFQASNFGGDREDYDIIKDFAELQSGTKDAWNQLFALAGAGFQTEAAYQRVQGNNPDGTPNEDYPVLLDVEALIDYMILHIYSGAEDWPDHNYWAARRRGADSEGFRFFVWDQEISNDSLVREYTRISTRFEEPIGGQNPSYLYGQLKQNETWSRLFSDRVHQLLFNDGLLTPAANHARWLEIQTEIDQSIVAESARWGDYRQATPYTREADWLVEMDWMRDSYWPQIHPIALERFRSVGLYPDLEAPLFSQHGGQFTQGNQLTITSPADTIYYTLDGSDPLDAGGQLYTAPLTIDDSLTVKARSLEAGEWSALTEASFQVNAPASAVNLAVSEVNYHAHEPTAAELAIDTDFEADDFDFIELQNTSSETIDLFNVEFTDGIEFHFTAVGITTLAPGEFVVLVEDQAAFTARYGTAVPIAGTYAGALSNSGEQVTLLDRDGAVIADFAYADSGQWPQRADGSGSSLEVVSPAAALDMPTAWRASSELGGSPGFAGQGHEGEVVINEVLTHTDLPLVDYIELHNTTDQPIDIGHWVLSDSTSNYDKFRIPAGTVIEAGGYLTFDENDFNPGAGTLPRDFALSASRGETLSLLEGDSAGGISRFVDLAPFPAAANGEALGRWPNSSGDLYPMISRTPAAPNSAPRVGPVIVSELMYHPPAMADENDHLEFVEIINAGNATVDLTQWSLSGVGGFSFPAGQMLAPSQVLVIVSFDPTDPAQATELDDFRTTYGLDGSTLLVGPYTGQLDNGGERIELFRADEPPAEEPGFYPQLLEDRVTYLDMAPWPQSADGASASLTRLGCGSWGDDPNSWTGAIPTPGAASCTAVVGRHLFYDGSSHDGGGPAGDAASIAPDKQALLPGETATAANFSNYVSGLNGVIVELAHRTSNSPLSAADFAFHMGNDNSPAGWSTAPTPTITTLLDADAAGVDRVSLHWPAGTLANTWLQVTVRATANTGLLTDDRFYFGNLIGDVTGNGTVDATDFASVRANPASFFDPAAVDNHFDLDRDRRVNATDLLIVREHATGVAGGLTMITPGVVAKSAAATGGKSASAKSVFSPLGLGRASVVQGRGERGEGSKRVTGDQGVSSEVDLQFDEDEGRDLALLMLIEETENLAYEIDYASAYRTSDSEMKPLIDASGLSQLDIRVGGISAKTANPKRPGVSQKRSPELFKHDQVSVKRGHS